MILTAAADALAVSVPARAVLTLADLEEHDPFAANSGPERDFCCPLPGCASKPVDAAHRSLSVNTSTGKWICHRCGESGLLHEKWQPRTQARRAALHRAFALPQAPTPPPSSTKLPAMLAATCPVASTAGARYLAGRGLAEELTVAAGVVYAYDWYGRPAVVFPVVDRARTIVAANGRYIDGGGEPVKRTAGSVRLGVFATPGALNADPLVITEAPIDALSLATAGTPAVALCGTTGPEWLPSLAVFRRVALAFDADDAGDAAAAKLEPLLMSLGARVERWRPEGAKDWNGLLQRDPDALRAQALTLLDHVREETPLIEPTIADEASPFVALVECCNWDGCTNAVTIWADGSRRCGYGHDQAWELVGPPLLDAPWMLVAPAMSPEDEQRLDAFLYAGGPYPWPARRFPAVRHR